MTTTPRTIGRIAGAIGLIAACCAATAQDKPVELRFAHWLPASHPLAKLGFEPWAKGLRPPSRAASR